MKKLPMRVVPVSLKEAQEYVRVYHRHNKPPVGHKFSIGVKRGERLLGVATVGRPVARALDDGLTLEVNRTCTTGVKNVNSMLYGAAWRAAKAMGYMRMFTYTQGNESGASLRAAGFILDKTLAPRKSWLESTKNEEHRRGRDVVGNGGVSRVRWVITAGGKQ